MPNINETSIAFTPYLCQESAMKEKTNKTNGDLYYCYDVGRLYLYKDSILRPITASQTYSVILTNIAVTTTLFDNVNNLTCIIVPNDVAQNNFIATKNIAYSTSGKDLTLTPQNTSDTNSVTINIIAFYNVEI